MPIRADLRHFYRGAAWRAAREAVRARARDACEQCGRYNGSQVQTISGKVLKAGVIVPYMFWRVPGAPLWHSETGDIQQEPDPVSHFGNPKNAASLYRARSRRSIRVVCTVAHLNHTPGDDRHQNLAFLCQWCHFHYDARHHHETRATRKDAARPILAGAERGVA